MQDLRWCRKQGFQGYQKQGFQGVPEAKIFTKIEHVNLVVRLFMICTNICNTITRMTHAGTYVEILWTASPLGAAGLPEVTNWERRAIRNLGFTPLMQDSCWCRKQGFHEEHLR